MNRFPFNSRNSILSRVLLPVFTLFVFTACLKDKRDDFDAAAQAAADQQLIENYIQQNGIAAVRAESGLFYRNTVPGRGDSVKLGDVVSVHYNGVLLDGTVFDNSYERGIPLTFQVGARRMLPGFEEGVFYARKGGRSTLLLPSHLAYGREQRGEHIAPNSVLRFDVEVFHPDSVASIDDRIIQAYLAKNNITNAVRTDSGFYYIPQTAGAGARPVNQNNVKVEYRGKFLDGSQFDPRTGQSSTLSLQVGVTNLIKGFSDAVRLLQLGESATFILPSRLAYGAQGSGQVIPPHAVLIFDIKLIEITN